MISIKLEQLKGTEHEFEDVEVLGDEGGRCGWDVVCKKCGYRYISLRVGCTLTNSTGFYLSEEYRKCQK